jgi:hypothetical protein
MIFYPPSSLGDRMVNKRLISQPVNAAARAASTLEAGRILELISLASRQLGGVSCDAPGRIALEQLGSSRRLGSSSK